MPVVAEKRIGKPAKRDARRSNPGQRVLREKSQSVALGTSLSPQKVLRGGGLLDDPLVTSENTRSLRNGFFREARRRKSFAQSGSMRGNVLLILAAKECVNLRGRIVRHGLRETAVEFERVARKTSI